MGCAKGVLDNELACGGACSGWHQNELACSGVSSGLHQKELACSDAGSGLHQKGRVLSDACSTNTVSRLNAGAADRERPTDQPAEVDVGSLKGARRSNAEAAAEHETALLESCGGSSVACNEVNARSCTAFAGGGGMWIDNARIQPTAVH